MKFILSLALVLLHSAQLLAGTTVFNLKVDDSGSELSLVCPFSHLPPSGTIPLQARLKNGLSQPLEVTLDFATSQQYSMQGGVRRSHKTEITADPNQTQTSYLLVPSELVDVVAWGGALNLSISSNSPTAENGASSSIIGNSYGNDDYAFMAVSEEIYRFNGPLLASAGNEFSRSEESDAIASFIAKELPPMAEAFNGVDLLMISDTEWASLSADVRGAIKSWIVSGGNLVVAKIGGLSSPEALGMVVEQSDSARKHTLGLGQINFVKIDPKNNRLDFSSIRNLPSGTNNLAWNNAPSSGADSLVDSIIGAQSNRLILIFVLLAFAILVGPVNLFVFAPIGRRHRLFFTTPLIAIGTSLLLAIGVVISDGFGGTGTRVALVEIENTGDGHRAHIIQEQAAHLGIVFGTSFLLESGTSIRPFESLETEFSQFSDEALASASFNLSTERVQDGIEASGDWFSSRSDVAQQLRNTRPGRGEVTVTANGDSLELSHSFNFNFDRIYYRDDDGELWTAEFVKTGTPARLTKVKPSSWRDTMTGTRSLMSAATRKSFDSVIDRRGRFFGLSTDFPMIETLDSIDWEESRTLVTGTAKSTNR